jgi:ABC-type phosphate/phosphonate transport system substrate-binding protein
MRNEGLDPGKDLAHIGDVGNPTRVIESVYDSIYDAGATCVDARDQLVGKLPDVKHRVLVISASHPIPNEAIVFAGKVPEEIQEKTIQTLLKVANDKKYKNVIEHFYSWEGLVRTRDSFYDSLRETLSTAGVETKNVIK